MCSLGARLVQGEPSSSICGSAMIDNITNTSKGAHQAVGASLATALRDRQAYVIPIQPNRSLPVRPAPHRHTPSRGTIVKSSLGRSCTGIIAAATAIHSQALVPDAPAAVEASSVRADVACARSEEKPEDSTMSGSLGNRSAVTTSENFIDISRSPERIDLSDEMSICPSRLDSSSPGCWVHGLIPKEKRKRRRRVRRVLGAEEATGENTEAGKTVPPLRLKKIQTLQEPRVASGDSVWQGIGRETEDRTFDVEAGLMNLVPGVGNKYRIVTGHTPPYEERINTSDEPLINSLDAAKLRYRQTKLKLKLRELRRKTVELGKEMLRSVFTSSTGARGCRLRQTMNRYEEQIRNVEKLLSELPKVSYAEESVQQDWNGYREAEQGHLGKNCEQAAIVSPARTICSSDSSSLCSSPSLEPPKLSPRSPTNYEAARSPSEVRNSPPVLPRVYVTVADCTDGTWNERYSRRGRARRRNRSPLAKPPESIAGPSSPVISTTTDAIIKDKIELVVETDNFASETLAEIGKSDPEILEVYDEPKASKNILFETKMSAEISEDVKPTIKRVPSPQPVAIDTTTIVDSDYEAKPQLLPQINDTKTTEIEMVTQPISSSCEILDNLSEHSAEKDERTVQQAATVRADVAKPHSSSSAGNGLGIGQQFPSLGNWLARLSKKQVSSIETSNKLPEAAQVGERSSAFQQVFGSETVKSTSPEVPRPAAAAATIARPVIEKTANVASQWRADRWQESQSHQTRSLAQSYAPTLPLRPPPPPPPPLQPSLGQEFCSPIAMARLYTRNYAIDPYSVAYGYNPAIAAAAATASFWNSAAILQYPLVRPSSSLLNGQQSRIPPGSLQFPGSGQTLQRPNYRVSVMQQNDGKQPENSMSYARDGKILPSGYASSFEQAKRASVEYHHAVAAAGQARGVTCNSISGQTINYRNCLQQHQQQQQLTQEQQQQLARTNYTENSVRHPVTGSSWRTGHVLGSVGSDYNYGTSSPWNSSGSGNIFNSLGRTCTPSFVSASSLAVNPSRSRGTKDSVDSNTRNCETPHLGKVNYSPNTVSNLVCSNCGLAGSMFKCLGCEVAYYCDENCQARHWSRHVISCPKKMPKLKKLVH